MPARSVADGAVEGWRTLKLLLCFFADFDSPLDASELLDSVSGVIRAKSFLI